MSIEKQLRESIRQQQTCRHCGKSFRSADSLICQPCLNLYFAAEFTPAQKDAAKSSGVTQDKQK